MIRRRGRAHHLVSRFAAFVFAALTVSTALELPAQTTPSPDQLGALQSMTPEQQQAVIQQLSGGGAGAAGGLGAGGLGTGATGTGATGLPRAGEYQDPAVIQRLRREEMERRKEAHDEIFPVLKPDDTVLISVDYFLPRGYGPNTGYPRNGLNGVGSDNDNRNQNGVGNAGVNGNPSIINGNPNAAALGAAGAGSLPLGAAATQPLPGSGVASGMIPPDFGPPLSDAEQAALDKLIDLIRNGNPYRLDRSGALQLPGFPAIPLAGLSERQATLRLQAEPSFRRVEIKLTRLPLAHSGFESLKPFGYDLFDDAPSTFAPVTDVPVPADYVVGPGDQLSVQLFGSQNRTLRLLVGGDGVVNFPELGPISVGGQRFSVVQSTLESRIARQMIGVHGSVSMGNTRSIRVFVLGEAKYPGSYTVSGLATVTSALFASGGVKLIGSLRNIELKRQGVLVRKLDLYDLLLRGDTRDDAQLLPGDVIFIPPIGTTAAVEGEVRRPAIYELKGQARIEDLIDLAGGLTPDADTKRASLSRIDLSQRRVILGIDLGAAAGKNAAVFNGDALRVSRLRPEIDAGVQLQGYVYRPGAFEWHEGMRLTEVLGSVDEVKPDGDLGYILIRRELPPDRRIVVLSADLNAALRDPGSSANVPLMPRDRITVFDLASGRDRILTPLINELRIQGGYEAPTEIVKVEGRVKVPGEYPLEEHMHVSDLIRAGGNLSDAAFGGSAELTRYEVTKSGSREAEHINVDLAAVLRGDPRADLALRPFDYLSIKETPAWGKLEEVTLKGEVRFPGTYPIRRGETLKALIERAGGLTDLAFARGAVFTRTELRRQEQEQLDILQRRLRNDVATLALQGAASANASQAGAAVEVGQSLLGQLQGAKAVGRLVINLNKIVNSPARSSWDVELRDGDELIVPELRQEVTVIGEVQTDTSHLYHAGLTRDDYIAQSGGFTHRADKGRIYVVRADGSVVTDAGNRWYQFGSGVEIETGDTIVVPLDVEHLPPLPLWTAVTTILYNIAVAFAAVHSI